MPSRLRWGIVLILAFAVGAVGWYWVESRSNAIPEGFARANGRLEAERIDIATKFAGRLRVVNVQEGDLVDAGQRIATFDTADLEARLREAEANVRQAREGLNQARSMLARRQGELTLANKELERAEALVARGHTSRQAVDQRRTQQSTAAAAAGSAESQVAQAEASIDAAIATAEALRVDLADHTLYAPRMGRVQYRLAEPGEVLPAGGRVVTLLDLTDAYMTIYLPTSEAGRLPLGAEARLIFDAAPDYVVPGTVTFVASEAQFTPKYVETESEREKLMFRVKVRIPPEILERYLDVVKTGVPGVCYVKIAAHAQWPENLAVRLPSR